MTIDEKRIRNEVDEIVELVLSDYDQGRDIDNMDIFNQPDRDEVVQIVIKLLGVLFPGYYRDKGYRFYNMYSKLTLQFEDIMYYLSQQVALALAFEEKHAGKNDAELEEEARRITLEFFRKIPHIRAMINTDIQATYDGDPAAFNKEEIVLSYPGLLASTVYRVAHELHLLGVPLLPRMMSEYAHSITGIDIHPGATIGEYFFMDHGTGIVVGSTSVIGKHVKIYQGVTIGALSTKGGHSLHGTRRHPTIEDNVTIYSGASILGGNTVIGEGSIIGGNAFITSSIAPGSRVSISNRGMMNIEGGQPACDSCDKADECVLGSAVFLEEQE
ncbi:MAG: serine acetyltransferase [Firmicutes bacterium]|nr:serine acetyltransferase [Bacillota bacterium]